MLKSSLRMAIGMTLLLGAQPTFAMVYDLNPIVVTAQRIQQDVLHTLASIAVITKDDLRETGARSDYEALSKLLGMSNYSYVGGYGSTELSQDRICLRGLDKGTLIFVNVTPLN